MIDSYASIVLERLPKIIPKRELSNFADVQRPECIRIAHTQHRTIAGSRLRLKQSIGSINIDDADAVDDYLQEPRMAVGFVSDESLGNRLNRMSR